MKVLLISPIVSGAMGQYLELLVDALSKIHDVTLVVPDRFDRSLPGNVKFCQYKFPANKLLKLMALANIHAASRVFRMIGEGKYDVVHVFNGEGYPWVIYWLFLLKKQKIPVVLTLHDPEPHPSFFEFLNSQLRKLTYKYIDAVHIHSKVFFSHVEKCGLKNISIIPHGDISGVFTKYKSNSVNRENNTALLFGRMEYYKGVDVFVNSIIKLKGRVKGIIAGPGSLDVNAARLIQLHPQYFELHNRYLNDQDVAVLFMRSSVCVLPYRQATQSSLPMLAAAFGVPVVASSLGAFVEDVQESGGVLVIPDDVESLSLGILEALKSNVKLYAGRDFETISQGFTRLYADANSKSWL